MRQSSIFNMFSKHNMLTVRRIAIREIRLRVVGTIFGFAHYFITPLFYLSIYTWLFSDIFVTRWAGGGGNYGEFALRVYAGLIVFQFFSDVVCRASNLILENPSYVTKIVFPLEILVPAAMATSFFVACINYIILLGVYVILVGLPSIASLSILLVWPAFLLFVAGIAWCLSSLGVYLRDLSQFVSTIVPATMFISPIFYPMTAVPSSLQGILFLNPLALFIESSRGALIDGVMPSVMSFGLLYLIGLGTAFIGYVVFDSTKRGFADVV